MLYLGNEQSLYLETRRDSFAEMPRVQMEFSLFGPLGEENSDILPPFLGTFLPKRSLLVFSQRNIGKNLSQNTDRKVQRAGAVDVVLLITHAVAVLTNESSPRQFFVPLVLLSLLSSLGGPVSPRLNFLFYGRSLAGFVRGGILEGGNYPWKKWRKFVPAV